MVLPSKKLLSVITGIPISKSINELGITRVVNITSDYDGTYLNFKYQDQKSTHLRYFNLYELVHKCKEWAIQHHNKAIQIIYHKDYVALNIFLDKVDTFVENTEPEAVLKLVNGF